jgi:hypothetical protein
MQINCKQCGAQVPAEHINLDRLIAKCTSCHSVFSFADQIEDTTSVQPVERVAAPMPKRFEVNTSGGRLEITRRWFSFKFIFLTFFTLFWDGFMVVWFGIAISQGIWPMAAFGTLHGAVGIGLLYYVLAGYLNKTVITVDKRELAIAHGPLPWFGNKQMNPKDIEQLYCKEKIHHSRRSTNYSYEVHAILRGGTHEKILSGLDESEQVLYIEQEIERFLEIKDRPVRGELGR